MNERVVFANGWDRAAAYVTLRQSLLYIIRMSSRFSSSRTDCLSTLAKVNGFLVRRLL